ncbi:MAG: inorganic diphosphatase [Epsilonproteobacteria bacterium]|nr:MAG: inorganic diphosphatase [Campylobacterota bacterium]
MKTIVALIAFSYLLMAQNNILEQSGEYKILSSTHLVDGIAYKKNSYQALIEIPAGTTAKWEVNHKSGHLEWEFRDNKPREVKFIGYPGNYGFIPQTVLSKEDGGDGDPLDIIVLGSSVKRGSIQEVKILGAIKLLDSGEQDDKIIAVTSTGTFKDIETLGTMMMKFPGVIEIVRYWFEGYKGDKMHFMGYMNDKDAKAMIERAHLSWKKQAKH